jgi:hypothetical protein
MSARAASSVARTSAPLSCSANQLSTGAAAASRCHGLNASFARSDAASEADASAFRMAAFSPLRRLPSDCQPASGSHRPLASAVRYAGSPSAYRLYGPTSRRAASQA